MNELRADAVISFRPNTYELGYLAFDAQRICHSIRRWSSEASRLDASIRITPEDWQAFRNLSDAYRVGAGIYPEVLVPLRSVPHITAGLIRIATANMSATVPLLNGSEKYKQTAVLWLESAHVKGRQQYEQFQKLNDCITEAQRSGTAIFLTENENESTVSGDIRKRYTSAA